MLKKALILSTICLIPSISISQAAEKVDTLSFMITNDGINRGEIKIRQREESKSPYMIIGCNNKSSDFYVSIGNIDKNEFNKGQFKVNYSFKNKVYSDMFIPSFMNDTFMLTKKINNKKDNQLFVYNYLLESKVVMDFGNNTLFYFNAKDPKKLVDSMNIIVSHCGMSFDS